MARKEFTPSECEKDSHASGASSQPGIRGTITLAGLPAELLLSIAHLLPPNELTCFCAL